MISISIRGLSTAVARIERLGSQANLHNALEAVSRFVVRRHLERVHSEKTTPDGARWRALEPSTIARKGSSEIMVHTSRLASSIRAHLHGLTAEIAPWGVPYAGYHQGGTSRMVQRELMGVGEQDLPQIHGIVVAALGLS